MAPPSIDELLAEARSTLARLNPEQAMSAVESGAVLLDIRSEAQRAADGVVPGAAFHPRNVVEWRCDPASEWRDPDIAAYDRHIIVMCNEGYQSSLVAATLQKIGLTRATDLDGGFQAWRAAGLPVE
jgi:rhodanese-related sulfurtransferase